MTNFRYLLGVVTLLAAVLGGVYILGLLQGEDTSGRFPLRIEFRSAQGLRSGADVRLRGVPVGVVHAVRVSPDGLKAVVDILLNEDVSAQACANTVFWVVTPRFKGIAAGASGLDTLVRDSYVSFLTAEPRGPGLPRGALVSGRSQPPRSSDDGHLEPVHHGDLVMETLVPENHGLRSGSDVRFLGMTVGDVRRVRLAAEGDHVVVELRIDRTHRHTVTDQTRFWVARPSFSMQLMSGISVKDIGALLSPYVGYHTDKGAGLPVEDGYRVAALVERPKIELQEVPQPVIQKMPSIEVKGPEREGPQVVRVVYAAVEEDVLSGNDIIRREGTGLIFADQQGRTVVMTARSGCDAAWTERDIFGWDPEIIREEIKIVSASGAVLRAGRNWVDTEGGDLALLVVEAPPADLPLTAPQWMAFDTKDSAMSSGSLLSADPKGEPVRTRPEGGPGTVNLGSSRGALVIAASDGRVLGLVGQKGALDEEVALVPIRLLPKELRPQGR